jgi:hypothetical protein
MNLLPEMTLCDTAVTIPSSSVRPCVAAPGMVAAAGYPRTLLLRQHLAVDCEP